MTVSIHTLDDACPEIPTHAVTGRFFRVAVLALVFVTTATTIGNGQVRQHANGPAGTVEFPISCSNLAQVEFARAVALLHHMTYPGARQGFEQVANIDSQCAMAHWGIAMTLFQPLWPTRPAPEELQRGWDALERARIIGFATERERLWVDAAAAFFHDPTSADYWLRIRDWEQAMERVYVAFPDDPEAAAFYALAHLAIAPSDTVSHSHSERAASLLLAIYERNPAHPGAMHYLVHANDIPERAHERLEVVQRYEIIAPNNPHALHMPTHIYTRLGDWGAVIRGNLSAADAALQSPAGDSGEFVWDEFPHALEYLVYAYLQGGADEEAEMQLNRLHGTAALQPTFKTAFHLASTRARYALERRDWTQAMSLPPRDPPTLDWDRFTWPEAVTWFARGFGAAREGRTEEARKAVERLSELESTATDAGEALFGRNIRILGLEVQAWLTHAQGERESSVALMREAAELEAETPKHPVTPAPLLPAYELLGDLLLEQGDPGEALVAYRHSLEMYPSRFNTLLGAARAASASSDDAAARTFYEQLLELASEGRRRAEIDEARTFMDMRH